jgi:hypothetical protein
MSIPRNPLRRVALVTTLIGLVLLEGRSASTSFQPPAAAARGADNVILITLDGVRWQEIFGGLDIDVLRSTLRAGTKIEETRAHQRYWAATPEARRERLMPFFWRTLMTEHGSIAGNRARRGSVDVTNRR